MPSKVALPAGTWPSLLDFLSERFPHMPRATWLQRLARGDVRDARGMAFAVDAAYRPHQRITYYREVTDEPVLNETGPIVYSDEHLLVLDKPHFLPVVPSGPYLHETALVRLRCSLRNDQVTPIHRLDRETAGLVMFSLRAESRAAYQALFREHRVAKVYEAVAGWRDDLSWPQQRASRIGPGAHFMQRAEVAGRVNSSSRIEPIARAGERALYRLEPRTGQQHQLRVHMAALGLPILHDRLYPTLQPVSAEDRDRPLQLLARELRFSDPLTGREHCLQSGRQLAFAPSPRAR